MPEQQTLEQDIETAKPEEFFQNALGSVGNNTPKVTTEVEITQAPKPLKVDPKESAKALAQQRDNLQKELDKKNAEITALKEFEELAPLKPIAGYIKTKFSKEKLDEDGVNKFIEHNKGRKQRELNLQETLNKKDKVVEDIEITFSDKYKKDFSEPWSVAENSLTAILCPVDNEGQPKNLNLIAALQKELLTINQDGTVKTPLQIKGVLQKFAAAYEKQTQESFIIPDITKVTNGILTVAKCAQAAIQAKQNWAKTKEEDKKKSDFENAEVTKLRTKQEIDGRNFKANKLITDFDYTKTDGIFDKKEVEKKIKDNNDRFIKMFKGEEAPYAYEKMVELAFKADAYDDLLTKYRTQEKELQKEKSRRGSGLPSNGSERTPKPSSNSQEENDEVDLEKAPPQDVFKIGHQRLDK